MALRPLVFGARLKEKGRSVRVRAAQGKAGGYVVEETRGRKTQRRDHATLQGALSDMAGRWRARLH